MRIGSSERARAALSASAMAWAREAARLITARRERPRPCRAAVSVDGHTARRSSARVGAARVGGADGRDARSSRGLAQFGLAQFDLTLHEALIRREAEYLGHGEHAPIVRDNALGAMYELR